MLVEVDEQHVKPNVIFKTFLHRLPHDKNLISCTSSRMIATLVFTKDFLSITTYPVSYVSDHKRAVRAAQPKQNIKVAVCTAVQPWLKQLFVYFLH
jgi:hypothetical protein